MRYVQSRVYLGKTCEAVDRIRGVYILISDILFDTYVPVCIHLYM